MITVEEPLKYKPLTKEEPEHLCVCCSHTLSCEPVQQRPNTFEKCGIVRHLKLRKTS